MMSQVPGRRPSSSDATVGLLAILGTIAALAYGLPLAILLWRAAL